VVALALAALAAPPAAASAEQSPTFEGHYVNAFVAGRTADGRQLAILAGSHVNFPYADSAKYEQVAVLVGEAEPVVLTGRPQLGGLEIRLSSGTAQLSYAGNGVALDLRFDAVRHPDRFEGDPAQLGDLLLGLGAPSDHAPGFVYTPYDLTGLRSGTLVVGGERIRLATLHGQAEAGRVNAPTDRRFETAYDYMGAPTIDAGPAYTYVGFVTHSLHGGSDGALDSYFRQTASEDFTLERGALVAGNPHGVATAFDNTRGVPAGARNVGQWSLGLGPGVLYRKLLRMRDRGGRPVLALSETIHESGTGRDATPPVITGARARRSCRRGRGHCRRPEARISFRLSEPALVNAAVIGRAARVVQDDRAGLNVLRLPFRAIGPGRRTVVLRATDQAGNRSPAVRLKLMLVRGRRRH
jgi:hypothetical protein